MTSELKPCPFCRSDKISIRSNAGSDGVGRFYKAECRCGASSKEHFAYEADPETYINVRNDWNTRAVPDVPELVRYDQYVDGNEVSMQGDSEGEYVLHSQAAEIIAAERKSLWDLQEYVKGLRDDLNINRERAEAAEAKLAQIKAQEPAAYTAKSNLHWLEQGHYGSIFVSAEKSTENTEPLYAAPCSAKPIDVAAVRRQAFEEAEQGANSDIIKELKDAIAWRKLPWEGRHKATLEILERALSAIIAFSADTSPKNSLNLSNLLRHAFISGFEANGGTITEAINHWPDYNPEQCQAYERVVSALSAEPAQGDQSVCAALVQEPVAWWVPDGLGELGTSLRDKIHLGSVKPALWIGAVPLYAAPVPEKD